MNDLIEWLKEGIDAGHITSDEAFNWVARKADDTAPSRLRPVPADGCTEEKVVRLKKDGTPMAKPGRKAKQPSLPVVDGGSQ